MSFDFSFDNFDWKKALRGFVLAIFVVVGGWFGLNIFNQEDPPEAPTEVPLEEPEPIDTVGSDTL